MAGPCAGAGCEVRLISEKIPSVRRLMERVFMLEILHAEGNGRFRKLTSAKKHKTRAREEWVMLLCMPILIPIGIWTSGKNARISSFLRDISGW